MSVPTICLFKELSNRRKASGTRLGKCAQAGVNLRFKPSLGTLARNTDKFTQSVYSKNCQTAEKRARQGSANEPRQARTKYVTV